MSQKDDTSQLLAAAFLSSRLHLQALPPGELGSSIGCICPGHGLAISGETKIPTGSRQINKCWFGGEFLGGIYMGCILTMCIYIYIIYPYFYGDTISYPTDCNSWTLISVFGWTTYNIIYTYIYIYFQGFQELFVTLWGFHLINQPGVVDLGAVIVQHGTYTSGKHDGFWTRQWWVYGGHVLNFGDSSRLSNHRIEVFHIYEMKQQMEATWSNSGNKSPVGWFSEGPVISIGFRSEGTCHGAGTGAPATFQGRWVPRR